jgi:hypothetical protein
VTTAVARRCRTSSFCAIIALLLGPHAANLLEHPGWLGSRSFVTPQREHLTGPQISAIGPRRDRVWGVSGFMGGRERQGAGGIPVDPAQRGGDLGVTGQAEQPDREVAQGGHDLGAGAVRMRLASSAKLTSRTQWSASTCQWARARAPSCCGLAW